MTEQEKIQKAIDRFKRMKEIAQKNGRTEAVEQMEVTISALEKQIWKRPDYEGDGYADGHMVYDTWICPCCGERYEVDYDDYNHCPECGQRILWEGEG